jgi:outer membrane protein assembly factor BamA
VLPVLFALALSFGPQGSFDSAQDRPFSSAQDRPVQEVLAEIRIQGNVLTPDDEVRQLAGLETGMAIAADTPASVAARLRATRRFKRVEVLKRFASISDPTQIVLVVILDEGPVKIDSSADPGQPPRVVRSRRFRLMFLPLLKFEDGYGVSYGVRFARSNPLGRGSQLAFPLTWGGDKRAAVELNKNLARGPVSRVQAGAAVSRRRNPFFEQDDDRQRVWVTAERDLPWSLRASATAGWQHVAFLDRPASNTDLVQTGADLAFDTRLDPMLARNAVYARAAWERTNLSRLPGPSGVSGDGGHAVNQTTLDARGYLGLIGQSVLVVRALREDADRPVPPYLKSMLGGVPNLRGFRRGTAVGDTLVAGSIELRVPVSSPLSIGKIGVSAFVDVAKAYDKGERFADQKFERGIGGGVWLSLAFLRLNVAVAHGIGGSTRVHVGTTVSP